MHQKRCQISSKKPGGMQDRTAGIEQPFALVADMYRDSKVSRVQKIDNLTGEMMHIDCYIAKSLIAHPEDDAFKHRHPADRHQSLRMFQSPRSQPCAKTGSKYKRFHHNCL